MEYGWSGWRNEDSSEEEGEDLPEGSENDPAS